MLFGFPILMESQGGGTIPCINLKNLNLIGKVMLMNLSDIILIITENRDPIFELSNLIWKAAVPTKVQGFCWWAVHEGKYV